jgi:hypothetical protein
MKKEEKEEVKRLRGKLKRGDIECYESTIIEAFI